MEKFNQSFHNNFILGTSFLSGLLSCLYIWKGYMEEFTIFSYIIIFLNFLYIPLAFIFKKKIFSIFNLVYALILIFYLAFTKTYLYNNYTSLFIICIVFMINPKFKMIGIISYFIGISICFGLNDEHLYQYFIHICRSLWFVLIVDYVISNKFNRKKLILYEDEIKILEQLNAGKHYQKEVEGFSENTIYRKLKSARERNGIETREELLNLYREEFIENKEDND